MSYLHLICAPAIPSALATSGDGRTFSPQLAALRWHCMSWLWLSSSVCLQFSFSAVLELLQRCPHFGDFPPRFIKPDGLWSLIHLLESLIPPASSATALLGAPWVPSVPWSFLACSSVPAALPLPWFPPPSSPPCEDPLDTLGADTSPALLTWGWNRGSSLQLTSQVLIQPREKRDYYYFF